MNYYISDTHFGATHSFPNEVRDAAFHDPLISERWNGTVTNADHIYLLGDIGRTNESLIARIANLKGNKHLIVGNHDRIDDLRLRQLFTEIVSYKELIDGGRKVVLSHYPMMFWNGQHNGTIHLYGHIHTTPEETMMQNHVRDFNNYYWSERGEVCNAIAINVGVMMPYMDYTPRTLTELMNQKGAI